MDRIVAKFGVAAAFIVLMLLFFLTGPKGCDADNPHSPPPGYDAVQTPVPAPEVPAPVASQPPPRDPRLNNPTPYHPAQAGGPPSPGDAAEPNVSADGGQDTAAAPTNPKVGCGGAGAMAQQP